MEISDFIERFSDTTENRSKAIFNTIFIVGNRLQTIFDQHIPEITLKQFMLLSMVKNTPKPLTFTKIGELLGCSRQNIKKLAKILAQKGFIVIDKNPEDRRKACIFPTAKTDRYFKETFSVYQKELKYLFEVYTEDEIQVLFTLMMKLYDGTEHLARNAGGARGHFKLPERNDGVSG